MKKTRKLELLLQEKGYYKMIVKWENYTKASEMNFMGGGYEGESEDYGYMWLGYSYKDAVNFIKELDDFKEIRQN